MGVKWLKKETSKFRQRRREIGEVAIYYLSKQAVIVGDERFAPHYVLIQSWHDRNKTPFTNFVRNISSRKHLTLMEVQLIANRYGVQSSSASYLAIPPDLRPNPKQ